MNRPFNVTRESYNLDISNEYNAVDWPHFFLGSINTLWRAITNESKTKIEFPGLLISLLMGKLSDWAHIISYVGPGLYAEAVKKVVDDIRGKPGNLTTAMQAYVLPGNINIYKILFVDYKKVHTNEIEEYKELFKLFKEAVNRLKTDICKKLPVARDCTTTEIGDLKRFRPDKARKEMDVAVAEFKRRDAKFGKFAEEVALWIEKNILEYLSNNIIVD